MRKLFTFFVCDTICCWNFDAATVVVGTFINGHVSKKIFGTIYLYDEATVGFFWAFEITFGICMTRPQ